MVTSPPTQRSSRAAHRHHLRSPRLRRRQHRGGRCRPRPSAILTPGGRLPYGSELIADIRTSARRESVGVAVEFGIFVNGYIPGPAAHDPASEHTQLMREANFVIHADK